MQVPTPHVHRMERDATNKFPGNWRKRAKQIIFLCPTKTRNNKLPNLSYLFDSFVRIETPNNVWSCPLQLLLPSSTRQVKRNCLFWGNSFNLIIFLYSSSPSSHLLCSSTNEKHFIQNNIYNNNWNWRMMDPFK